METAEKEASGESSASESKSVTPPQSVESTNAPPTAATAAAVTAGEAAHDSLKDGNSNDNPCSSVVAPEKPQSIPASRQTCGRCCAHLHSSVPGNLQPLTHLTLFETPSRFFLVGRTRHKTQYRVLKIDRYIPQSLTGQRNVGDDNGGDSSGSDDDDRETNHSSGPFSAFSRRARRKGKKLQEQELHQQLEEEEEIFDQWDGLPPVTEDQNVYSRQEILKLFGSCPVAAVGVALLGFVRLLAGHYIVLATRRRRVGCIAGHPIYTIDGAKYISVVDPKMSPKPPRSEARYKAILEQMDLTHDFYFSYGYNLTRTLQYNMTACRYVDPSPEGNKGFPDEIDDQFMWNTHFVRPMLQLGINRCWITPIIFGYYSSEIVSLYNQRIVLSLIARRSRYSAGARFLKRGVLSDGHVANDVEIEQIVVREEFGALHPCMSSYVQVRGSIPLFWSQDTKNLAPKPAIHVDRIDPFYDATIRHFQNLFERYGTPIMVLNLIKTDEKVPRESLLAGWFRNAIDFINKKLPPEHRVRYVAWDISKAMKTSKDSSYLNTLMQLVMDSVSSTGFFCTRPSFGAKNGLCGDHCCSCGSIVQSWQSGALRTNCIDSLDRTNAAQFSAGRCALALQLVHLGVIPPVQATRQQRLCAMNDDVLKLFLTMYERMGNAIAVQYGGSGLANTMDTYSGTSSILSQGRDLMTTVQRYYRNSFTDAEKQQVINLFLGVYVPSEMHWSTPLWALETDYHLHNPRPELTSFVPLTAANLALVESKSHDLMSRHLLCTTQWWKRPLHNFHMMHEASADRAVALRAARGGGVVDTSVKHCTFDCTFEKHFNDWYRPEIITFFDQVFQLHNMVVATFDYVPPKYNSTNVAIAPSPAQKSQSLIRRPSQNATQRPQQTLHQYHQQVLKNQIALQISIQSELEEMEERKQRLKQKQEQPKAQQQKKTSEKNNAPAGIPVPKAVSAAVSAAATDSPSSFNNASFSHFQQESVSFNVSKLGNTQFVPSKSSNDPGATFNKTLYQMTAAALGDSVPTETKPVVKVLEKNSTVFHQYETVGSDTQAALDSFVAGKMFEQKSAESQHLQNEHMPVIRKNKRKRRKTPLSECVNPFAEYGMKVGSCEDTLFQRRYAATAKGEFKSTLEDLMPYMDILPRLLAGSSLFSTEATINASIPVTQQMLLYPSEDLHDQYEQSMHITPELPDWYIQGKTLSDPSQLTLHSSL